MMQQQKLFLLVVLLWSVETLAFSVVPFGVQRVVRSTLSPPTRESLRVAPTLSSWFQWGTEPKKEATKAAEAEEATAAPAEEAAQPEAAIVEEVVTTTSATEEVPQAASPEEANGTVTEASTSSTETVKSESTEDGKKRQPKKVPVKRDRHTIFVGNLPFDVTDKDLRDLIADHATVEFISIPRNRESGQARGFAFVDVANAEEIQAVIQNVDGVMVGGRSVRVTESLPKEEVSKGAAAPSAGQPKKRFTDEGAKKIYVGNLPFDTDRDELIEYYGQWGEVKDVYVPINPNSGEPRGFAFVTMETESADKAIEATNGVDYRGRKLAVSVPLPPGEKTQRVPRQVQQTRTKLYVGNLSFYTVADTIRELFEQYGTVHDCYMPEDPSSGGSRGFGFVTMDPEDAQRAIADADGIELDGRLIRVNEAQVKKTSNRNYNDEE